MLFDLIVIGSGPAGQKAALQGAKAGKKVVVVERDEMPGGGCLHWGTLPSKSFRESVYRWSMSSKGSIGSDDDDVEVTDPGAARPRAKKKVVDLPDMARLLERKQRVVTHDSAVIAAQFKRNGVTLLHGRARITSSTEVEVRSARGTQRLTAGFIIVATGARPVAPKHLVTDGDRVVDSDSILGLPEVPKSLVVLGGGIIGCEYASIFATAGTRVTLVDRRTEVLASVDRELVGILQDRFRSQGVEILLETEAKRLEKGPGGIQRVHLSNDRVIEAERVMVALGRRGNTEDLGLEAVGLASDDRGLIKVDRFFRTTVPNIYAVGDVVGAPALASTSMEQGRIACCHAFRIGEGVMAQLFPYGIYTIPEISMVGATEEELKAQKVDFIVGRARYGEIARGQIVGDRWGLLKLVIDRKTLKILGVHVIGEAAANLVHIGQAVMDFGGDVTYFVRTVFNYPTLAEAYKSAAFNAINQLKEP